MAAYLYCFLCIPIKFFISESHLDQNVKIMSTTLTPIVASDHLQMLLNGPAGTPPAGVLPNFQDPPNMNSVFIMTLILVEIFGTLAVVMRIYTKACIVRSFVSEDCRLSTFHFDLEGTHCH